MDLGRSSYVSPAFERRKWCEANLHWDSRIATEIRLDLSFDRDMFDNSYGRMRHRPPGASYEGMVRESSRTWTILFNEELT
jgi:hypothetical protein